VQTVHTAGAAEAALLVAPVRALPGTEHRYSGVSTQRREAGASLYTALMDLFRTIFEPWEQHPGMLTAYFRARSSPHGQQLLRRGLDMVAPAGLELLADVDDEFIANFDAIISSVVYGLLGRFATGEIAITDILPTLDRTVYRLTRGYEAAGAIRDQPNVETPSGETSNPCVAPARVP